MVSLSVESTDVGKSYFSFLEKKVNERSIISRTLAAIKTPLKAAWCSTFGNRKFRISLINIIIGIIATVIGGLILEYLF